MASNDAYSILDRAHDNFATAKLEEAFNWSDFASKTNLRGWYMVAFRSNRKPSADLDLLDHLETLANDDAANQPGYLFYFKGKVLPGATHLRNLSFCMWQDRECATVAAQRSAHRSASAVAQAMYEEYRIERYLAVVHTEGERSWVEFERL